MSQPSNINQHLGEAIRSGYALGPKVASGGTLDLQSKSQVCFELAAGTYKVPNAARFTEVIVYASGAVTLTLVGGTTIVTIASGDVVRLTASSTSAWKVASHTNVIKTLTTSYGYVPIPLTQWREVTTNDISDAGVGAADSSGGVLATDTTPALEYINGDTNSSLRLLWAASNVDPLVCQVVLPADLDETQPIYFKAVGVMSGTSNTPVLSLDTYFTELAGGGMTKIEDDTSAFTDAVDVQTATIAASDFSSLVANNTPLFATIEITPGAHGTDTLAIYGTYLQYTKTLLTA